MISHDNILPVSKASEGINEMAQSNISPQYNNA